MPNTVGVPLIVTILADQLPVTPAGKPVTLAPVAPVVEYVMLVIAVLMHFTCASVPTAEVRVIVLSGFTVIAKVLAVPLPQAILLGVTVSMPEVAVGEKLATIELVPLPEKELHFVVRHSCGELKYPGS